MPIPQTNAIPSVPVPWGTEIPHADSVQDSIFRDLVSKGVPAGVALQQAQASRAMMHNVGINSDGYSQAQLMRDAAMGYTSLSPAQIYGIRSLFADPANAEGYGNVLSSPAAHVLLNRGMGSWKDADPDTAYQQALRVTAEQIRANLADRGTPISTEDAYRIAQRYIGDKAHFNNFNDITNSAGSGKAVGEINENLGTNLGLGAGMHVFQDAFLGHGAPNVGWKATLQDAKQSVLPFSGITRPVDEARSALQAAMRSGDQVAISTARNNLFAAASKAPGGLSGLGNAVPAAFGAMPLAFGGYQALSNNYRGETATDFLKRMAGVGYPGTQFDVDRDDAITMASIIPHAMAQGYMFNTLPTQLGSQLKSNPVGALRNSLYKGTLVSTAPEALTRAAALRFGSDNAKAFEARRILNERNEMAKKHELGGMTANMSLDGSGGALEGISSRGIFGQMRNNFEGAGAGDMLMGGLQSLADVGMAPMRMAAQYGVGVPTDIATTVANAFGANVDKTLGSKARNFADPSTALSQLHNSLAETTSGTDEKGLREMATRQGLPNRAAEAQKMRNSGADIEKKFQPVGAEPPK